MMKEEYTYLALGLIMVAIYFIGIFALPYDCSQRLEAQERGDYNWESIDCN